MFTMDWNQCSGWAGIRSKINRVESRPLGDVVTAECHRGATVVKPVGFATGNGEGSRRRIRTLIALQNPVA